MTDPFRLQVLKAICERIRTISPGDGFQNDLSGSDRVVRGRLFIGDDEPLPMVAVNEPPPVIAQMKMRPRAPVSGGEWDILIQGWAEDDAINPCDPAYVLSAEVRMVLARELTRPSGRPAANRGHDYFGFGARIDELQIGAPVVRPPDNTSRTACFYLLLTMKIVEDMSAPFN